MSILQKLNALKNNVFGGPGSTGPSPPIGRKSAIELAKTNPLIGKLDDDPFEFTSMVYPQSMSDYKQEGQYIIFYINTRNPSKYDTAMSASETAQTTRESYRGQVLNPAATTTGLPYNMSNVAGPLKRKLKVVTSAGRGHSTKGKNSKKKHTVRDSEGTDLSLEKQKSTGGMNSYADLTTRIQTSIALYLPPNIESKYSVNYNTAETGTLGFMAASAAGVIGSAQKADQKSLAKQIMGVVGSTLTDVGLKVGGELASAAGLGEGGAALGAKFFGIASNPYMEVLFENPAMREFTYSFNFTPKSQKETQEIKEIIETFRTHMAPELKSDFSRYMMLPSEFDIHYVYQDGESDAKENTYMNKIATCVLKDCSVNYHPNGEVQVHADGSPVSINMSLTFAETEMITKEKIKQGF